MVLPCLGTRNRSFLARSTPFWMASGTSLALPYPTPTTSRSSPTTTRAVNENRRPPLTTLATRLISTTRSCRSRPVELTDLSETLDMADGEGSGRWAGGPLDRDPGLAEGVGERAHVAVVAVAATIEDHLGYVGRAGSLGEQLARALRTVAFAEPAQLGLEPVDSGQRAPADVVDQLGREAAVGAEHRDTRALRGAGDLRPYTAAAFEPAVLLGEDAHARLPTLRA